jgi:fumarate reductase flavoprotein subunit
MNQLIKETEVVVIGSGAAGLVAAVTAAEGGAKVLVLEKQRSPGGTSNFFTGIFAVESPMQREKYITYNRDEAFKGIMDFTHWRAHPRLVRAVVDNSAGTLVWLQKQGVEFKDVINNMPGTPRTYHRVKGKGEALIKALVTRARDLGIQIRLSTPAKRLIKQGERISGVIVENEDGEDQSIKTGAVIIATGGYANNKEWIKKYAGFDLGVNIIPVGNVDKMGDGIRMAWEMGAAEEGLGTLELFRVGPQGAEFAMGCQIEVAAAQPDLWVDPQGERFCDESISFYDTLVGNASARYREGYNFSLFDDSIIQRLIEKGPEKYPETIPLSLEQELKTVLERGSTEVMGAASIAELALQMGVAPAVLSATVDQYNHFCLQGHDDLFAKDIRYLRPLKGPRYYAVKSRTVFLGTKGGIKINEKTEVIDKKGRTIPGLYATGFDAGGMYGDSYPITPSSGLSSAFALNSGRIAGQNSLKFLGKP